MFEKIGNDKKMFVFFMGLLVFEVCLKRESNSELMTMGLGVEFFLWSWNIWIVGFSSVWLVQWVAALILLLHAVNDKHYQDDQTEQNYHRCSNNTWGTNSNHYK